MFPRLLFPAALVLALAIAFQLPSGSSEVHAESALKLTVRNVTGGQPLTPPIAVVLEPGTSILPVSSEELDGLEELAEAGEQEVLAASLAAMPDVKEVVTFDPPPILPGEERTVSITAAEPGDRVSVITMLACTNDAIAYGNVIVPDDGDFPAMSSGRVLDAGTEVNDETEATVPCFGLEGGGVSNLDEADGEGVIADHPGIIGNADLTSQHAWQGPAMELFLTDGEEDIPGGVEFGITLENTTVGQPITPPVVVVHDRNVAVFDYVSPTELDGIDDLAEAGAQGDLLATLRATPGVVRAYGLDSGGPIGPGASYTEKMLNGIEGADVTVVGMLACTNDAYIRVSESLDVVRGSLVATGPTPALVFDSGSEANDETTDTVPCLGGERAALSEGLGEGERAPHAGITGVADLSVETHGWTEGEVASLWTHGPVNEDSLELVVTVRNVISGQPITPPVVIVHTGTLVALPSDAASIPGLETLAESGEPSRFAAGVVKYPGVKSATVLSVSDPIPGGGQAVASGITAAPGDFISVITMLACTNDAVAFGTAVIPPHGGMPLMSSGAVYDAGTELNDESEATVPCLGGEGVSTADGEGVVALHHGIDGNADLESEAYDWYGPAIEIFVTSAGVAAPEAVDFGLTLENLTAGQPITPPVVVVHDPNVGVFEYDIPTELDGIDDLSESGAHDDLLATLSVVPGVVRAYGLDSGGPVLPGASYTEPVLHGIEGANVTVVGMFACTNDGYVRATQTLTVISEELFPELPATALVFDSGAEFNEELAATVPCLGGGPAALSRGLAEGTRSVHPGISGVAHLSQETHGWTSETTALLFIHGPVQVEEEPAPAPTPVPEVETATPPATGDFAASATPLLIVGMVGMLTAIAGFATIFGDRRKARARQRIK